MIAGGNHTKISMTPPYGIGPMSNYNLSLSKTGSPKKRFTSFRLFIKIIWNIIRRKTGFQTGGNDMEFTVNKIAKNIWAIEQNVIRGFLLVGLDRPTFWQTIWRWRRQSSPERRSPQGRLRTGSRRRSGSTAMAVPGCIMNANNPETQSPVFLLSL